MFLWCMSELCPFASMIRQFRCPLTLQTAALHRAALAFLYLRQHPNDARTNSSACNAQKQSELFESKRLHAHLPPTMTEKRRVLEPARL
jgi:hypothetical protein